MSNNLKPMWPVFGKKVIKIWNFSQIVDDHDKRILAKKSTEFQILLKKTKKSREIQYEILLLDKISSPPEAYHTVTAILTALTGFPYLTGFLNEFESLIVN